MTMTALESPQVASLLNKHLELAKGELQCERTHLNGRFKKAIQQWHTYKMILFHQTVLFLEFIWKEKNQTLTTSSIWLTLYYLSSVREKNKTLFSPHQWSWIWLNPRWSVVATVANRLHSGIDTGLVRDVVERHIWSNHSSCFFLIIYDMQMFNQKHIILHFVSTWIPSQIHCIYKCFFSNI